MDKLQVYFLTKSEGGRGQSINNNAQATLFCKTWDSPVFFEVPEGKDMIMPGEDTNIKLTLSREMVRDEILVLILYSCYFTPFKSVYLNHLVCPTVLLENLLVLETRIKTNKINWFKF